MIINKELKDSLINNFDNKQRFALAVSGGPDSQCLLKSFTHVARRLGHEVVMAIGCDHGLRENAGKELDAAEALCNDLNLKFVRLHLGMKKESNLHAKARDSRYAAMRNVTKANDVNFLVTAHHFDDRAETVLIRLLRGKNIGSLGVLKEINGDLYRPLLNVTREDIIGYLARWKVPYATDPSNDDLKYTRAKVRNVIIPLLEQINPSIKTRLNEISDEVLRSKNIGTTK